MEALTPITPAVLDKVNEIAEESKEEPAAPAEAPAPVQVTAAEPVTGGNGMIHIEIGKAEKFDGLKLDVPVFAGGAPAPAAPAPAPAEEKTGEKTVIRSLVKKHIKITDVKLGTETSIKDGVITINKDIVKDAVKKTDSARAWNWKLSIRTRDIFTQRQSWMCAQSLQK